MYTNSYSRWAGFNLSRKLDKKKYQTVVISPRPYFTFTPLLASTAVGTLEFRTAIESVRARVADTEYYQGWADDVSFADKRITVEVNAMMMQSTAPTQTADEALAPGSKKGKRFQLDYDKLVVAVGCYSQTFGTPGVRENAFFLKDVGDARKIRTRILDCMYYHMTSAIILTIPGFEEASLPSTPENVKRQLLNFAVVGGGRESPLILNFRDSS
jgi:NADH dehydrogenase